MSGAKPINKTLSNRSAPTALRRVSPSLRGQNEDRLFYIHRAGDRNRDRLRAKATLRRASIRPGNGLSEASKVRSGRVSQAVGDELRRISKTSERTRKRKVKER